MKNKMYKIGSKIGSTTFKPVMICHKKSEHSILNEDQHLGGENDKCYYLLQMSKIESVYILRQNYPIGIKVYIKFT